MEAAEQLLEQRRLPDDHVDEVDAAVAGRVAPAGDLDERRDGMRLVRQEDVVARGDELERDHAEHEHGAHGEGRRGGKQAPQAAAGARGGACGRFHDLTVRRPGGE